MATEAASDHIPEGTDAVNEDRPRSNCPSCFKDGKLSLCGRCGDISYCSTKCQKTDWPFHKLLCSKLSSYQQRPEVDHVRAILFPAERTSATDDMQRPRFVWVKKMGKNQWEFSQFFNETAELLKYSLAMSGQTKPIATQQMFIALGEPWATKPTTNRAIQNLGNPGICHMWLGNVVIVGANGDLNSKQLLNSFTCSLTTLRVSQLLAELRSCCQAPLITRAFSSLITPSIQMLTVNVVVRDFRAILDWFQCHHFNKALLDPSRFVGDTTVGVRAHCLGEVERFNCPALQQVHLTTEMATRIGFRSLGYFDDVLPLACTSADPHALGMPAPPHFPFYHFNSNSLLLMLDSLYFTHCEDLKDWKKRPTIPTGSITFIRNNMLTPLRLEEFKHIQDFLVEFIRGYENPLHDVVALRNSLTRDKFHAFLKRQA